MCKTKLLCMIVVLLGLALLSSTQVLADSTPINYTYTSGGNTFQWQLPTNPVPSLVDPGFGFELTNVSFTENGVSNLGTMDFFSAAGGEPGFDLWIGDLNFLINAFGPQMYTGPEDAPTMLPGSFGFIDTANPGGSTSGSVSTVPEPSSLLLLGVGLLAALAISVLRKS